MGVPAAGDGLRLGDDLLATVAGVAGGRRLATAARAAAGEAATRPTGSTGRGPRSTVRTCGRLGGAKTGPSPVDRSRRGSKHHLITCGRGTPLAVLAHRRQPQRHHPDAPAGRRRPARARPPRPPAPPTAHALRRPRLPLARGPARTASPRHPGKIAWPKARTAPGWAASAGWSSARSPGCTSTAACASATSVATTSTKPSSRSAAA